MPTNVHTRACACPHVCAQTHIGGRRRAQRPTPHRTPAERVALALARRPGAEKAAHTEDNEVTDAVFHAPMSALNADAPLNACEPSHPRSTPTSRARMCRRERVGARSHTRTRTRARTDAARGRACAAGPHRRSVRPCSYAHGCSYMHELGIHPLNMCVFHRWMALRSKRVALAHRPRVSASSAPAHDRTRMQEHTRATIYISGLCVDIYIYIYIVHDVGVGYISRRTYPRMRT
jgi:hypothetical protein